MAVVLIFVGTNLELVAAGAALHLHILRRCLLLAKHRVDAQFAELQLGMESPQLLAALDEIGIQRERHVGGFQQL